MILTQEKLEGIVDNVLERLSEICLDEGFDILDTESYVEDVYHEDNSGDFHQEIIVDITWINNDSEEEKHTEYNKVVYEDNEKEIEDTLYEDFLNIVK